MLGSSEKRSREEMSGARALLDAMSNDQLHLARFLLDAQDGRLADVGAGRGAHSPLTSAALLPEPEARARFLQLLLERGAAVDARDAWGRTALSHACERGHLDAARRLVQAGADPEVPDAWNNTALQYAVVAGHAPVAAFLVRSFKRLGGLDVYRVNRAGNSALRLALALGHEECVKALTGVRARPEDEWFGSGCPREDGTHSSSWAPRRCMLPHLPSMHSIKEEGSGTCCLPSPQPPRTRSWSLQYGNTATHLPPLPGLSPQLSGISRSPGTGRGLPALPGHLAILLTPLPPISPRAPGGARRGFNATYYQKRSSLPSACCLLSPTCDGCPGPSGGPPPPPVPQPPSAFSSLGNKLFRRFTFPEFRKQGRLPPGSSGHTGPSPESGQRGMARSETFPLIRDHPQVASKPSIDSISSVQCEFDFPSQT
ncbi:ankyrin repeat domain-containing protein 63-like [Lissotriton helveticus]